MFQIWVKAKNFHVSPVSGFNTTAPSSASVEVYSCGEKKQQMEYFAKITKNYTLRSQIPFQKLNFNFVLYKSPVPLFGITYEIPSIKCEYL